MMKNRIYIASPYTGNKEVGVQRQLSMTDKLMNLGFAPFVPLLTHYQDLVHPRPYDDWMELDETWLLACHGVLRLDGESEGADREVALAKERGIPVFYDTKSLFDHFKTK